MSGDRELGFMTASALVEAYRRKILSPGEATKAALARIERLEPKLNTFLLIHPDRALPTTCEQSARHRVWRHHGGCTRSSQPNAGRSSRVLPPFWGARGRGATLGGVPAYPPSAMGLLSKVGPMALNVSDTALMLTGLAGPD